MAYLTRKEAADMLKISLRTLDGLVSRGQLPAYRVGPALVRIKESDIEAFLEKRLVQPTPSKRAATVRPCLYKPGMKVV